LEQPLRDERARAGSEAGPRPGARTDVPEPLDRRRVAGAARERAPEEVLIERERTAVRIAVHEVDVHPLEVGRGENDAVQQARLEVRDVPREPCLDAVGVALLETVRPDALADVELARGVALHVPGQLL